MAFETNEELFLLKQFSKTIVTFVYQLPVHYPSHVDLTLVYIGI